MTSQNENKLQTIVSEIVNSCKGTSWEAETIKKIRLRLKNELGMREILIDRFIKNA